MASAVAIFGLALVAFTLIDLVWTTIAAGSGAGPMTGRLADGLWRATLGVHRRRPSHRLLTVAGVAIVFAVLAVWIGLILIGWSLVFGTYDGAVRDATTAVPADLGDRLYFVGYTVFTLGTGDFVPGDGTWQAATVIATGTGLVIVTLAITYLVPVASAVARRRALAGYISSLGSTPSEILRTGWNGDDFADLSDHFVELAAQFGSSRQEHLTYPVIHYFHTSDTRSAAPLNIANLAEVLHLLSHGAAPSVRPPSSVLESLERSMDAFLDTLRSARLPIVDPLLPPQLDVLRRVGVPTVDDASYERSAEATKRQRVLVAALLADDGWVRGMVDRCR
jgi:hypothetical protein